MDKRYYMIKRFTGKNDLEVDHEVNKFLWDERDDILEVQEIKFLCLPQKLPTVILSLIVYKALADNHLTEMSNMLKEA